LGSKVKAAAIDSDVVVVVRRGVGGTNADTVVVVVPINDASASSIGKVATAVDFQTITIALVLKRKLQL
jgi:hypothetical protein